MPKATYTDTPLAPNVKDVLQLGVSYDWKILKAEEKIIPATGNELMEMTCKESETEAISRMVLFFTPKTFPQVTRFLRACGIERPNDTEIDVNEELIKGRTFAAKLKEGREFMASDGKSVTPWEIDAFSCASTRATPTPAAVPAPPAPTATATPAATADEKAIEEGYEW